MNFNDRLDYTVTHRRSHLCVGLDVKEDYLPESLRNSASPILEFNREIIKYTEDLTAAYKLNLAFYEVMGEEGYRLLKETLALIPDEVIKIGDAKRGDIGHSAEMYARALFDEFGFDAVTVSPYMGYDSVKPFMTDPSKGVFVLVLTSNSGAADFQYAQTGDGSPLFLQVARRAADWNENGNVGMVLGATKPYDLVLARSNAPELPALVPGIGAQGGDLGVVLTALRENSLSSFLITSSRGIICASSGDDFAAGAREAAKLLRDAIGV